MTRLSSCACLAAACIFSSQAQSQSTTRVSVNSLGGQASKKSAVPSISGNGHFIAFHSEASNLVPGDTNLVWDVFIHDRHSGKTRRVSLDSSGFQANADCLFPSISFDGRFVAFHSRATNLVPGDTNGVNDIYVHDTQTRNTTRVSLSTMAIQGKSDSLNASISSDGRFIAFESKSENLVFGDTNGEMDVFVHDLQSGRTGLASISSSGQQGDADSFSPSISSNGRHVAFHSYATNLVPGDANGARDVFVRDILSMQTARVSVDSSGNEGNFESKDPSITNDGRLVVFVSWANNLVSGDTNGFSDVFVHDRFIGETTRVSVDSMGSEGNRSSLGASPSQDGQFITFWSGADNLVAGDSNGVGDVFVHDRKKGRTFGASLTSRGRQGNGSSNRPSISSNGQLVAFESGADNLIQDDTNSATDVFVRDHFGPSLSRTGFSPGSVTFFASGTTPGNLVAFVWGSLGKFTIPSGYPCVGKEMEMIPLFFPPPGFIMAPSDALGTASVTGTISWGATQGFVLQAIDIAACSTTNTMAL